MPFDLAKSLASLPQNEQLRVTQRLELVFAAQRRLGMEPRNDSQLTWKYANNELDEDEAPSAIANELCIVDSLFKETSYSDIIEDVLRELANHIKGKYKLNWTDTWELTRFYGPTMLKLYCYKKLTSKVQPTES